MATAARRSDDREVVDLAHFRREMTKLGYKVRIRTNSEFKTALILDGDGVAINAGNVLTQEHLQRHAGFYEYRNAFRVRDGDWVVVL